MINFKFPLQPHQKYNHTVWRMWLFIAHSDGSLSYYQFSLPHTFFPYKQGLRPCLHGEKLSRGPGSPISPKSPWARQLFIRFFINRSERLHDKSQLASGRRVPRVAGSLGWRDRVTLGAGPTFLHVNTHWLGLEGQLGIQRVKAMFYAIKQHGGEYEEVNSTSEKMVLNFLRLFAVSRTRGPVLTRLSAATFFHVNAR